MSLKPPDTKTSNPDRLKLSGQDFGSLVMALVEKNAAVKLKASGTSMFPNILNGDILTLVPYQDKLPKTGDVACLYDPETRQIIIHRIIKKINGGFLLKGDNVWRCDGVFGHRRIIGYVSHLERNKKTKTVRGSQNIRNVIFSKLRIFSLCKLLLFGRKIKWP